MATAGVPLWSTTAASNATADPAVNYAEGQAPSSLNDSARAAMASVAKWRDDLTGSTAGLSTGGSSTAYTVTTNSTFATAAAMSGVFLTIIPHATSGAAPTLAVDGLTARAINISTGVAVPTGALILGTPYLLKYVHATTEFILVNATAALPNSNLAPMAANTIKANATSGSATPTDATLGSGLAFSSSVLTLSLVIEPQGRLTLTSATPVLASDVTAATTVYYTPYKGNLIPIYNGTIFALTSFTELSMVMSGANFAASGIYDLFVISDSGTIRLGIGPVWGTLTAGSGARGTGAGTTELQLLNGIWTNKVAMTLRYASASTVSVSANQATYAGSIFMDSTNSQVSCTLSYGQSRKLGLWNAYNRKPVLIKAGDSTANWTHNVNTIRASRNVTTNSIDILVGLPEEMVKSTFRQRVNASGTTSNVSAQVGIGWNVSNAFSGYAGQHSITISGGSVTGTTDGHVLGEYQLIAPIGRHVITSCEQNVSANATTTFYGTEANMLLTADYWG